MKSKAAIIFTLCLAPFVSAQSLPSDFVLVSGGHPSTLRLLDRREIDLAKVSQWHVYYYESSDENQKQAPWGLNVAASEGEAMRQISRNELVEKNFNSLTEKQSPLSIYSNYIGPVAVVPDDPNEVQQSLLLDEIASHLKKFEKYLGVEQDDNNNFQLSKRSDFLINYRHASRVFAELRLKVKDELDVRKLLSEAGYATLYKCLYMMAVSAPFLPHDESAALPRAPLKVGSLVKAPALKDQVPFGILINGKPGYVLSPWAQVNQLVDVTGLPAGLEVKCPYTGKVFRVPATK